MMRILDPAPAPVSLSSNPSTWWRSDRKRYESDEARHLLAQNGLEDVDRLFALADRSLHGHKGRAVSRVTLHQSTGEAIDAFVKLNWGRRRLVPRMTDLRTGQAFHSHPEREWRGIGALRSLGLLVPERLALFQSGWFRFREAVIIQRVPPKHSIDDMIRRGAWDQLSGHDRQEILEGVVRTMQRIHEAGLGWRGTCTRHFFPERTAGTTWRMWLIDCEGVHGRVTKRAISRNYRKLYRAFEISGANAATLRQFQMLSESAQAAVPSGQSLSIRQRLFVKLDPKLKPTA